MVVHLDIGVDVEEELYLSQVLLLHQLLHLQLQIQLLQLLPFRLLLLQLLLCQLPQGHPVQVLRLLQLLLRQLPQGHPGQVLQVLQPQPNLRLKKFQNGMFLLTKVVPVLFHHKKVTRNGFLKGFIMSLTNLIRPFPEKSTGVVNDGPKDAQADSSKSQMEHASLEEIFTPMRPILEEKKP